MRGRINKERVNDTAKLIMHRLIARRLGRDLSLVEKAKHSLSRSSDHFGNYTFIHDWSEFLSLYPKFDIG